MQPFLGLRSVEKEFPMAKRLTYKELVQKVEKLEKQAVQHKRAEQQRLQREKLQGVLEMAGAVCHELNQPMQALTAYCEYSLKAKVEDNSLYDQIHKIIEKVDTMAKITRKLQNIATYETKDYLQGTRIIDIDKASATPFK